MISGFLLESGSHPRKSGQEFVDHVKYVTRCICEHKFRFIDQEFDMSRHQTTSTSTSSSTRESISSSLPSWLFQKKRWDLTCSKNHLLNQENLIIPDTNISWAVLPAYKLG